MGGDLLGDEAGIRQRFASALAATHTAAGPPPSSASSAAVQAGNPPSSTIPYASQPPDHGHFGAKPRNPLLHPLSRPSEPATGPPASGSMQQRMRLATSSNPPIPGLGPSTSGASGGYPTPSQTVSQTVSQSSSPYNPPGQPGRQMSGAALPNMGQAPAGHPLQRGVGSMGPGPRPMGPGPLGNGPPFGLPAFQPSMRPASHAMDYMRAQTMGAGQGVRGHPRPGGLGQQPLQGPPHQQPPLQHPRPPPHM